EVGILGLAFKPNTNSVAGSASVQLAQCLVSRGARVRAYDPVAIPDAKLELNGTVHYCESPYAAAEGVEALVVGTGWPEFRALDFSKIRNLLRRPLIVNTYNRLASCERYPRPPDRHRRTCRPWLAIRSAAARHRLCN